MDYCFGEKKTKEEGEEGGKEGGREKRKRERGREGGRKESAFNLTSSSAFEFPPHTAHGGA